MLENARLENRAFFAVFTPVSANPLQLPLDGLCDEGFIGFRKFGIAQGSDDPLAGLSLLITKRLHELNKRSALDKFSTEIHVVKNSRGARKKSTINFRIRHYKTTFKKHPLIIRYLQMELESKSEF